MLNFDYKIILLTLQAQRGLPVGIVEKLLHSWRVLGHQGVYVFYFLRNITENTYKVKINVLLPTQFYLGRWQNWCSSWATWWNSWIWVNVGPEQSLNRTHNLFKSLNRLRISIKLCLEPSSIRSTQKSITAPNCHPVRFKTNFHYRALSIRVVSREKTRRQECPSGSLDEGGGRREQNACWNQPLRINSRYRRLLHTRRGSLMWNWDLTKIIALTNKMLIWLRTTLSSQYLTKPPYNYRWLCLNGIITY